MWGAIRSWVADIAAGTVERQQGVPTLTFRFHDVNGKVGHEDRLTAAAKQ